MVNCYGKWVEEIDYKSYPKEKWCDYDVIANYIRNAGYIVKTDMENLIDIIFLNYNCQIEETGYFEIKKEDDTSLNLEDIICYIEASGGFAEFDYVR